VLGTTRQQLQLGAFFSTQNHCYSGGGGFLCSHLAYFVIFTFALQKDKAEATEIFTDKQPV